MPLSSSVITESNLIPSSCAPTVFKCLRSGVIFLYKAQPIVNVINDKKKMLDSSVEEKIYGTITTCLISSSVLGSKIFKLARLLSGFLFSVLSLLYPFSPTTLSIMD